MPGSAGFFPAQSQIFGLGSIGVPERAERFPGVPRPRRLISVSFFGKPREVCDRYPETSRDALKGRPRRVAFAPLDQGKHVLRDPRLLGKGALVVAASFPQRTNRAAECALRVEVSRVSRIQNKLGKYVRLFQANISGPRRC